MAKMRRFSAIRSTAIEPRESTEAVRKTSIGLEIFRDIQRRSGGTARFVEGEDRRQGIL